MEGLELVGQKYKEGPVYTQFLSFFFSRIRANLYPDAELLKRSKCSLLINLPPATEAEAADIDKDGMAGQLILKKVWRHILYSTPLLLFHFFSSSILFSVIQQRSITHPGADARVVSGCKTEIRSLIPGAVLQQPVAQFSYGVLVHLYLNCWDSKIYSASKPTGLKYCLLKVEYICANTCQFDQMCLQMVCKNF